MTPLRETLKSAVNGRLAAIRNGRSHRKDTDRLNAAIMRAQSFMNSYPFATDERVKDYCTRNITDIRLIVPGNTPTALARLIMQSFK